MLCSRVERTSFTVTAFEFLRNRHMDSKNFFDLPYCNVGLLYLEAVVISRGLIVANSVERLADRSSTTRTSFFYRL